MQCVGDARSNIYLESTTVIRHHELWQGEGCVARRHNGQQYKASWHLTVGPPGQQGYCPKQASRQQC